MQSRIIILGIQFDKPASEGRLNKPTREKETDGWKVFEQSLKFKWKG